MGAAGHPFKLLIVLAHLRIAIRSVAKTVSKVDPCCFNDPRDLIRRLSDVIEQRLEDD